MELIKSGNNSDKYEEYEALLLERDQVSKESDQIWIVYMKNFGQLIAEAYEVKLDCIKCKKTIAYYQNAINHGGTVDADAMQEFLKREMAGYYANLKKMTEENARCHKAGSSTSYEAQRSKTLYRRLAKLIHPDINPETDQHQELRELWQRTVDAYHMNDIKALAELEVLVRKVLGDLGLGKINVQIPDIADRIEELRKEIELIRTTTPYTYLSLIEDSDAVERKKKELTQELEDYKAYREELRKVIDDLLAGGKITLLWHKN